MPENEKLTRAEAFILREAPYDNPARFSGVDLACARRLVERGLLEENPFATPGLFRRTAEGDEALEQAGEAMNDVDSNWSRIERWEGTGFRILTPGCECCAEWFAHPTERRATLADLQKLRRNLRVQMQLASELKDQLWSEARAAHPDHKHTARCWDRYEPCVEHHAHDGRGTLSARCPWHPDHEEKP